MLKNKALLLLFAFLLATLFGCVDEEPTVNGDGDSSLDADSDADGVNDSDADGTGDEEDCEEGFELNPFTGECVPESGDDDDGDGENGDGDGPGDGPGDGDNGDGDGDGVRECGLGTVVGEACLTNGQFLPGAEVTLTGLDCDGEPFTFTTTSDGAGQYSFNEVPQGVHELGVFSGSFAGERAISVATGQTTDLTSDSAKVCLVADNVRIMVIEGSFDDVPAILDELQLDYDVLTNPTDKGYFFSDPVALSEYDIIFVECSNSIPSGAEFDPTQIEVNLRNWVEQGNSLYASDLSNPFFDRIFPSAADFGGTISSASTYTFRIHDPAIQAIVGGDTVPFNFNFSPRRVLAAHPPTTVLMSTDLPPVTGGDTDGPILIMYREPIQGGTMLYTVFHNTPDGFDGAISDILNYLVFQL